MCAPLHSRFHTDHAHIRVVGSPYAMSANHAAAVPTCRSEQLKSKISESIPKKGADVESKEEEDMHNDSAAKQPADIEEEQQ